MFSHMQVGIAIVAFEYDRQRVKKIAKKQQEADEKMQIMERARLEREVRELVLFAFNVTSKIQMDVGIPS
jgi:hypothetical protein